MAFSTSQFGLASPTPLQLLIDEINFQRQKEMRQLLKDDSGFVVLQGTTWYTDLFVRHFLFQAERSSIESDDLLFFVRKKHIRGTSRNAPKYETELEVFRKDSKKLPIGDPDVDWEETVYLNLVIHQFDYTLTLAICTRTSPKELQVLRRHSQKVYASPSRRKMDSKGDSETITYPHICFMIDNFDEVFHDILVRDGEMVCVELVAKDRDGGAVQGVIFLGSIRYDALKKVYDARQSSLSTKVAQRMTFGLFSSGGPQTRCEFVRMKGPQGKGHAEMAVTKPKGSGVETPTSEPGFCATDMWDSDWEEDVEEYNFRHQRRLSDPSANLNYFSNKYAWRAKAEKDTTYGTSKARSEQEGLDCLASEVSEIESGDLRDDRPASLATPTTTTTTKTHVAHLRRQKPVVALSASESALNNKNLDEQKKCTANASCCDCFPSPKKRWSDSGSAQMSDVYIAGEHRVGTDFSTPACLNNMNTRKSQNLLSIESEIEFRGNNSKKKKTGKSPAKGKTKESTPKKRTKNYEIELADEACAESDPEISIAKEHISPVTNGKKEEKSPVVRKKLQKSLTVAQESIISSDKPAKTASSPSTLPRPKGINRFFTYNRNKQNKINENTQETSFIKTCEFQMALDSAMKEEADLNGNPQIRNNERNTLPKMKKSHFHPSILYSRDENRTPFKVPKRTTTDGTTIYYWCDVPKKQIKELDDGAYNPLWTSRGFTQTFHFWKENKRQQSTPLNAFLTYVTLPWWSIAKDLLDHRETPILTF